MICYTPHIVKKQIILKYIYTYFILIYIYYYILNMQILYFIYRETHTQKYTDWAIKCFLCIIEQ